MADIDIVMQHLKDCIDASRRDNTWCFVRKDIIEDALELLNPGEKVRPEREYSRSGITWWNICGACKTAINPNDKFCHECGRAVKWD